MAVFHHIQTDVPAKTSRLYPLPSGNQSHSKLETPELAMEGGFSSHVTYQMVVPCLAAGSSCAKSSQLSLISSSETSKVREPGIRWFGSLQSEDLIIQNEDFI